MIDDIRNHPVVVYAHGNPANAAAVLLLAAFLGVIVYQGNVSSFFGALRTDFIGTQSQPGFWKWALAILILYWLASNPATNKIFGPVLVIAIVAMLIEIATTQPTLFGNVNSAVSSIFGRGQNLLASITGS